MSENFNFEPRSRKYEGLAPLTKEVTSLTKGIFGQYGFVGADLRTHWADIIGDELAKGVVPVRLTFPQQQRSKGVLHVRVASGAFALLFEHEKARVIERVNVFFGYPAIADIRIVQGAVKLVLPPEPEAEWPLDDDEVQALLKKVDQIEDEVLRSKTFELGIALIQKRKRG